jgi:hypothetical protein
LRQLKEVLRAEILGDLTAHLQQTQAAVGEADGALPKGLKQCGKGHEMYPDTKAECPVCVRERQRAKRARLKAKREA